MSIFLKRVFLLFGLALAGINFAPAAKSVVLQNGLNGYAGCIDAELTTVGGVVAEPDGENEFLIFQE